MFEKKIGRIFGVRTDVRAVVDPWGLDFRVGIRRADDQRFETFSKKDDRMSPLIEATGRAFLKIKLAESLLTGEAAAARPGFRQAPKPTKAERQGAQGGNAYDPLQMIEDTADSFDVSRLFEGAGKVILNDLKPGIALLIDWWEGDGAKDSDTGSPIPCTLVNRLRCLGWEGFLVLEQAHDEATLAGIHFLTSVAHQALQPGDDLAQKVAAGVASLHELTGNPRNSDGQPYQIEADQPFGPALVGDGITAWLLAEAKKSPEYALRLDRRDAEALPATPVGAAGQ